MSVETYTFVHVVLSLVGIMTGFIVVALMLASAPLAGWNAFFLATTLLTSVTGFFFLPIMGFTPAQVVGAISVVVLLVALFALYGRHLAGPWRGIYVGTAVFALYLNCFVAVAQSFNKFAYLKKFAPTGSEPPFAVTQGIVLVALIVLGIAAVRRYRPGRLRAAHPPEGNMQKSAFIGVVLAMLLGTAAAFGQTADRLYVMDCGNNAATDQSRWSPGVNVGKPLELSDNCYLIRHGSDWLLWDTGYPDAIAAKPLVSPIGTATRAKTLAAQLTDVGVKPADIKYVAVSHTHGDHVGNVDMFPNATLLIQKPEVDFAFAAGKEAPFKADRPTRKLEGDLDLFGDGSLTILSTPGHTPGHQSLLVHLPKTGWVVLSGDAAHFKDNWDNKRVPSMNTSADQTQASYKKIADVLDDKKAQLWINHDKPQSQTQKHAPEFYD